MCNTSFSIQSFHLFHMTQQLSKTSNNLDEITSSGKLLLSLVNQGNFPAIDLWFKQRPDFFDESIRGDSLFNLIGNTPQCFGGYPRTLNSDEIYQWIKSRHIGLFKHFPVEYQLRYFVCDVHNLKWDIDQDYVDVFNYSPQSMQDQRKLKSFMAGEDFGWMISEFFFIENFAMLESLEALFQIPVMTEPYGAVSITYPDNDQIFQIPESAWIFTVRETVMIGYTLEKEAFLASKGLSLPDAKEAQHFKDKLLYSMECLEPQDASDRSHYAKSIRYIKGYQNQLQYWDLSEKLKSHGHASTEDFSDETENKNGFKI